MNPAATMHAYLDALEERHRANIRTLEERIELIARATRAELDVGDAKIVRLRARVGVLELLLAAHETKPPQEPKP
jgi:hypothetical protein